MTMQQRTEPSPAAVLIAVAVLALVLTVAFGPLGFVLGLALFALMFIGTKNNTADQIVPARTRSRLRRLSTAGRIAIVGEAHHQDAIAEVTGLSAPDPRDDRSVLATAVLVPESAGRHDHAAVRVDLLRGDGTAVAAGYLRSEQAADYQSLLLDLAERGEVGSCPARIIGSGQRYGVHLHLGAPRLLLLDYEALGTAPTLPAEHQVAVMGEPAHQYVLHRVVNGRTPVHVIAELRDCRIVKGSHTGEHTLEVLLEGECIGQLTYAMGLRYCDMTQEWRARTGRALCEAVITNEGTRGLQANLLLPK
ncbi:hypothetical protein SAMN04488074_1257 [Lentzea albidocapillata subsp. violacea]|uniref:Uncharacterized protein n=1 Tax=Lentzea albidocapillata subsp. violacea TaxID=128104 RepID=A0A1G9V3U2_9PSEU|nr:hypothetical protein [Lentzea albidocapillata]SDM66747.1 hypothetical protein SAMN04488074_1257 [Lentzea albidocapillata subsp. violacea]